MECEKVILEYFHLHSMQWEKYIYLQYLFQFTVVLV